jgi:hypothetical protein
LYEWSIVVYNSSYKYLIEGVVEIQSTEDKEQGHREGTTVGEEWCENARRKNNGMMRWLWPVYFATTFIGRQILWAFVVTAAFPIT